MMKRIICGLLACLMLVSFVACNNDDVDTPAPDQTEATEGDAYSSETDTEASTTSADETESEATEPEASETEGNQPEASEPEVSETEGNQPEASEPEASETESNQPEESEPEASEPEATVPSEPAEDVPTDVMGNPLAPDEILEVAKINYGGTEIRILQKDRTIDEMYAAKMQGELINDAVFQRNKYVQDYLGVKLVFDSAPSSVSDYAEFKAKVDAAVESGWDQYHIIANYSYNAPTLIQEGSFLNINGIEESQNLIDLEKRWWNQSFHDESEINGKLYMLCGDITTTTIDWAEVVFYNNDLIQEYWGEGTDILQMVYDFEWTYETFLQMVQSVGDGESTGVWGYTAPTNSNSLDGMIMGMAMDLTYRDSKNYPNMNISTTRNIEIGERLRALYNNDPSAKCAEGLTADLFCEGNSMFYTQVLVTAGKELRTTTLDYGVVPTPLYDEYQEEYRVVPQDNYTSLSILCHVVTSLPAVTRTLEVMGSESYISLRHCIQEKCYKQRYLKTEPKGKMFDYIVDNMYYDFGYTYSKMIEGPYQLIRNYARYPSGHGSYVESLPAALSETEELSTIQLELFLEKIFDMPN